MNKICLFLTASVNPQNTDGLKRNSVLDRESDYYNALVFYVKHGIPIVFCDNSMFYSEKITALCNLNSNCIEYISFLSKESYLGRGHGEKEIFDYAHKNSEIIKNSEFVVKLTGRLIVYNIDKIIQNLIKKDFMVSANISRNLSYSDSRFFVYKKEFYLDYFEPMLKKFLSDERRFYFEFCLARGIHNLMAHQNGFILLPFYPKYIGRNGTTDKKYKKAFIKEIKYRIYQRIKIYFFNHPI